MKLNALLIAVATLTFILLLLLLQLVVRDGFHK